MTDEQLTRLVRLLWPTDFPSPRVEVFAVLDGARDPRLVPRLATSTLDHRCLYSGPLPAPLVEVAPYLVHLHAHVDFTHELLRDGWGKSWGILLRSAAGIEELRRHFKRLLRVRDPSGRRLLFRFYDPRVLRAYLPTCTRDELAFVFGPARELCAEARRGDGLLEYSLDAGLLRTHRRPCPVSEEA